MHNVHRRDIPFHLKSQLWFCEHSAMTRKSFCSPHRLCRHSGHSAGRRRTVIDDLWAEAAYCEHSAVQEDKEGEGEECHLSLSITFCCWMKVPPCHFGQLRKRKMPESATGWRNTDKVVLLFFFFFCELPSRMTGQRRHSLVKVNVHNIFVSADFTFMFANRFKMWF